VQQFRYVTDSEADQLRKEREELRIQKAAATKENAPATASATDASPKK